MSQAQQAGDGLEGAARGRAMAAVSLAVMLSTLDYALANVALPTIARDIHTDSSNAIWVINAYQLVNVVAVLPLAALGERWGYRRMAQTGVLVFVVASVLCAVSRTLPQLAAARGLQGLGASCILSVNAGLIRLIYPQRILGQGIARNALVIALGVAIGPTVAAGVLSVAPWPYLFYLNVPLGLLAWLLGQASLPDSPRSDRRFDALAAVLLALGLGGLIVGGDRVAHARVDALTAGLLGVGLVAMVALVRRELGQERPLLPVDLLGIPAFAIAFAVGFIGFIASNFFIISMPFALEGLFARTPVETGLLITPWPVAIVLVAPWVGRLSDRVSAAWLSALGMAVAGMGFIALRLLPAHPDNLDIAWRIGLAGAGFGLLQPPNNRAMLLAAPRERTAGASGMISVARLLGQTVGAMLVALVLARAAAAGPRLCLTLAAATAFLSAGLSLSRPLLPGGRSR